MTEYLQQQQLAQTFSFEKSITNWLKTQQETIDNLKAERNDLIREINEKEQDNLELIDQISSLEHELQTALTRLDRYNSDSLPTWLI